MFILFSIIFLHKLFIGYLECLNGSNLILLVTTGRMQNIITLGQPLFRRKVILGERKRGEKNAFKSGHYFLPATFTWLGQFFFKKHNT